ncbi:hypothetical protein [Nesterenkonia natronophila]|uniref:DUF3558 domain-containing protein n=1 Tax=Nesterenkonia natronophila TaxID=2174932 RepID=A0A3A4F6M9_9MICC|nr:hypothetical protein [Nesterenkonia natronophila]RJN32140.1 hypothetical protein D3250_08700 [Nesterenkonia natronophila]
MSGYATASRALSPLSAAALLGSLAACASDEPEIPTVDPNDLETDVLEPDGADRDDPQDSGGGVCHLLSAEEIETVIAEPVGKGEAMGELGEVASCMWPHPEVEHQGVSVLSISDSDIPGEELFDSIASGEPTEVGGADEAVFDEDSENLWVRSEETVLQLQLHAFASSEDEFGELAEVMVGNL